MKPVPATSHSFASPSPVSLVAEASSHRWVEWTLRIAVAGCFIGHGAFGVMTKEGWLVYFAVVGIGEDSAWTLMPLIGWTDILIGVLALVFPLRLAMWWAAGWALWTAMLRPLAGESIWEMFERAGNYGAPLALLGLAVWGGQLFARCRPAAQEGFSVSLVWVLRICTFLLLLGHAGCNIFDNKASFAKLYGLFWPGSDASAWWVMGSIDLLLAALVLFWPRQRVLWIVVAWKAATESLWLPAGYPVWEVIERFGSIGVPMAYALILRYQSNRSSSA